MSLDKTDSFVANLCKYMQEYMKGVVQKGIYDKPASNSYLRTRDFIKSIQYKVNRSGSDVDRKYQVKVYFDTGLIRPMRALYPGMYNHHMSGTYSEPNPIDMSSELPEMYDKGFKRNGKTIQLNIIRKTKKAFPVEEVKDVLASDMLKSLTSELGKYKK